MSIIKKIGIVFYILFIVIACGGSGGGDSGSGNSETGVALESVIGKTLVCTIETASTNSDTATILSIGETMTMSFIDAYTIYGEGVNKVNVTSWEYSYSGSQGEIQLHYSIGEETIELTASDESGLRGTFSYEGIITNVSPNTITNYTGTYLIYGYGERAPMEGSETPAVLDSNYEGTATLQNEWLLNPDGGNQLTYKNSMLLDDEGNLLLTLTAAPDPTTTERISAIIKLDSQGQLDATFNSQGYLMIDDAYAYFTALGQDNQGATYVFKKEHNDSEITTTLLKYSQDGTLAESFGTNGEVNIITSTTNITHDIAIDDDLNLYLLSYNQNDSEYRGEPVVMKFTPQGTADNSFNGSGSVSVNIQDGSLVYALPEKIAVNSQGEIYVAGLFHSYDSLYGNGYWPFVAKLTAQGELDSSFADNGVLILFSDEESADFEDLLVMPDGTFYVTGTRYGSDEDEFDSAIFLFKYTTSGQFDSVFLDSSRLSSYTNGHGYCLTTDEENNVYLFGRLQWQLIALAYDDSGNLLYEVPIDVSSEEVGLTPVALSASDGAIYLSYKYNICKEWDETQTTCLESGYTRLSLLRYTY